MALLDIIISNFSIEEVTKSLHALKKNKAGGLDEVTAEVLKHGGETVSENSPTFSTLCGRQNVSQATGDVVPSLNCRRRRMSAIATIGEVPHCSPGRNGGEGCREGSVGWS